MRRSGERGEDRASNSDIADETRSDGRLFRIFEALTFPTPPLPPGVSVVAVGFRTDGLSSHSASMSSSSSTLADVHAPAWTRANSLAFTQARGGLAATTMSILNYNALSSKAPPIANAAAASKVAGTASRCLYAGPWPACKAGINGWDRQTSVAMLKGAKVYSHMGFEQKIGQVGASNGGVGAPALAHGAGYLQATGMAPARVMIMMGPPPQQQQLQPGQPMMVMMVPAQVMMMMAPEMRR